MPVLAGSFWVGILAWPVLRGAVPPWALLAWGVAVLAVGAAAAPRSRRPHPEAPALARDTQLVASRSPAPSPTATRRDRLARGPPVLPAIAAAATFFLLGAGWTGLHE